MYDLTVLTYAEGAQKFLAPQEEAEVGRRALEGDLKARNALVVSHMPLVGSMARDFAKSDRHRLPDLMQRGSEYLIHAADRFDYRKGFRFSTYASWWIREGLRKEVYETDAPEGMPGESYRVQLRIRRVAEELMHTLKRAPTTTEVMRYTKRSLPEVKRALENHSRKSLSLSEPVEGSDETNVIGNFIPDKSFLNPEQHLDAQVELKFLQDLLQEIEEFLSQKFSERDMFLFRGNIGIRCEASTLEDLGRQLQSKGMRLSRERIRQVVLEMETQAASLAGVVHEGFMEGLLERIEELGELQ